MNKFIVNYSEYLSVAAYADIELDPYMFINCDDEEQLKIEVEDYLSTMANFTKGDFQDAYYEHKDWEFPEGFLEEWRKIKEL